MNCSGKFFVPTMIGVAWFSAAGAAAAPPKTSATPSAIVNAALAARRLCLRITALPPFRESVEGFSGAGTLAMRGSREHIGFERVRLCP